MSKANVTVYATVAAEAADAMVDEGVNDSRRSVCSSAAAIWSSVSVVLRRVHSSWRGTTSFYEKEKRIEI